MSTGGISTTGVLEADIWVGKEGRKERKVLEDCVVCVCYDPTFQTNEPKILQFSHRMGPETTLLGDKAKVRLECDKNNRRQFLNLRLGRQVGIRMCVGGFILAPVVIEPRR